MTTTWYHTEERVAALQGEALSWKGTPFADNAAVKGFRGGVSCQMLVATVYVATRFLTAFKVPEAPSNWGRTHTDSLVEDYMDWVMSHRFTSVMNRGRAFPWAAFLPGDMLGIQVHGCVDHCALVIGECRFIGARRRKGVYLNNLQDPTWIGRRLKRVWRPKP